MMVDFILPALEGEQPTTFLAQVEQPPRLGDQVKLEGAIYEVEHPPTYDLAKLKNAGWGYSRRVYVKLAHCKNPKWTGPNHA